MCLAQCGDAKDDCLAQHPVRSPDDLKGDQVYSSCAVAPPPSQQAPVCDASTAVATERECAAAGNPCAGSLAVSREAALCVLAKQKTLTGLVRSPTLELGYDIRFGVPAWRVFTTTFSDPRDGERGNVYIINARDGSYLGELGWSAIP